MDIRDTANLRVFTISLQQRRCWIVLCWICIFSGITLAAVLPVTRYSAEDGLPRDEVKCTFQDSRGFMWFCTQEGASLFDGYRFRNFTKKEGLPSDFINDIFETKDGDILFATSSGIAKLNPEGVAGSADDPLFAVYAPPKPEARIINFFYQGDNDQIWFGTSAGMYRLDKKGEGYAIEPVQLESQRKDHSSSFFTAMLRANDGTYWFGTYGNGLIRLFVGGKLENYQTRKGQGGKSVTSILQDVDGRIWVGTRDRDPFGLFLVKQNIVDENDWFDRLYTTKDGLTHDWIRDLYQTRNGNFWVATNGGLCLFEPEKMGSVCTKYIERNGICDRDLWDLYEDQQNNLWVSSYCGVVKISRSGFITYNENDGLPRNIKSLLSTANGELYIDSILLGSPTRNNRRISKFSNDRFESIMPNFPNSMDYFASWAERESLIQDRKGNWWFSSGDGLWKSDSKFEDLDKQAPREVEIKATGQSVFKTFEDSRGDIWIATTRGKNELLRLELSTGLWHDYTDQINKEQKTMAFAFCEDIFGNIWIAMASDADQSAIVRYRKGTFKTITVKEGAPSGWIRVIYSDKKGRLWIGTQSEGLWNLVNPDQENWRFEKYTKEDGLVSNDIQTVIEDGFERTYVGTPRGLNRIDHTKGIIEYFGLDDGLPNLFIFLSAVGEGDTLWFGTRNGLVRFDPQSGKDRKPPTILVTNVEVDGIDRTVSIFGEQEVNLLELGASKHQVRIGFSGIGSNIGEDIQYEYRLIGSGNDWIAANERFVNIASLGAGDYRFEVRSITADKLPSKISAVVTFSIARPFWQRWYFVLAAVFAFCLIIYLIYRGKVAKLLEIERMRTRIASDLHDDIGANLTRISILSDVANRVAENEGNDNEHLCSIAQIARESVSSMNDIVWAISPENESLVDLVRRMRRYFEEVTTEGEIEASFTKPELRSDLKIGIELRHDLLLIFKEALNNAVKYSNCTRLEAVLMVERSYASLRISDNGCGFDVENADLGNGLDNMKRRADSVGGTLEITSDSKGTTINLEIPLS